MRVALALFAILCGVILALGALDAPRDPMRLRARQEGRYLQISVVMPRADSRSYRWLSVHLCSATLDDNGQAFCSGDFERESTMEVSGEMQHIIEWRDVGPGTVLVTAMAFDEESKVLASQSQVLFLR